MNNSYTLKNNCGERTNSRCVYYDLDTPEFSTLSSEECLVVEETTEDLYKLVNWLREAIEIKDSDIGCLDVNKTEDTYNKHKTRYLLKDVLIANIEKTCSCDKKSNDSFSDILNNLNYRGLVDDCGNKPESIQELLQMIIDKIY